MLYVQYNAGDIVEHEKFGKGIILGNAEVRAVHKKDMMFYHIFYYKYSTFGYAAKLTLINKASQTTIDEAHQILFDSMQPNTNLPFQYGDIVSHKDFGKGIIIGNGHKRAGKIFYHIYYYNSCTTGYNATFQLLSKADDTSRHEAKKLCAQAVLSAIN